MTFALRAGVTVTRSVVILGTLSTLVLVRAGIPVPVLVAVVGMSLAGTLVLERDAARFRPWALYTIAFVLFAHLRTLADELGGATRFAYPVDADAALFGVVPTVWLQDSLYVPGRVGAVDVAALVVYLSYFLVPHVLAFALWRRRLAAFGRYAREIIVACYVGLAVAFVVPTAPPWLAGQSGELPFVSRVAKDLVSADAHRQGYELVGANPVAAMPSLHMALTVIVAVAALRAGRASGILGTSYAASMGFALVYLGEHYVVDVLAGIGTALVAVTIVALTQRGLQIRPFPRSCGARIRT